MRGDCGRELEKHLGARRAIVPQYLQRAVGQACVRHNHGAAVGPAGDHRAPVERGDFDLLAVEQNAVPDTDQPMQRESGHEAADHGLQTQAHDRTDERRCRKNGAEIEAEIGESNRRRDEAQ